MAIYFRTITEADDPYQTPGDVGNDLDQIEKDICGPDGIESHRDEVEDAAEGMIGDPVEEAYYIMFEMNTNFNNLVNAIGISELNEASMGRQLVLEAADVKGFFSKAIDSLKKAFAKVVNFFSKLINDVAAAVSKDKAYIRKNGESLKKAWNRPWSVNGYKNLLTFTAPAEVKAAFGTGDGADSALGDMDAANDLDGALANAKTVYVSNLAKSIGVQPVDGKISVDDAKKKIYGTKSKITNADLAATDVISILSGEKEVNDIKKKYSEAKNTFQKTIKDLKDMANKKVSDENPEATIKKAKAKVELCTYMTSMMNVVYAVTCKALKDKRALYRTIAGAALGHVVGNPKTESPAAAETTATKDEPAPANESGRVYTAPFSNLSII